MLVLSRKKGDAVIIDEKIEVIIVDVSENGKVRLGINAPSDVSIVRKEIKDEVENENKEAAMNIDIKNLTKNIKKSLK